MTERQQLAIVKNAKQREEEDANPELAKRGGKKAYDRQVTKLTPKVEMAIRLYACGKGTWEECGRLAGGIHKNTLIQAYGSSAGQALAAEVRSELEEKFQGLFEKAINVIDMGLQHPEPSVALASANLWFKTARATKVEVKLTAEDLVQKIMNGEEV